MLLCTAICAAMRCYMCCYVLLCAAICAAMCCYVLLCWCVLLHTSSRTNHGRRSHHRHQFYASHTRGGGDNGRHIGAGGAGGAGGGDVAGGGNASLSVQHLQLFNKQSSAEDEIDGPGGDGAADGATDGATTTRTIAGFGGKGGKGGTGIGIGTGVNDENGGKGRGLTISTVSESSGSGPESGAGLVFASPRSMESICGSSHSRYLSINEDTLEEAEKEAEEEAQRGQRGSPRSDFSESY